MDSSATRAPRGRRGGSCRKGKWRRGARFEFSQVLLRRIFMSCLSPRHPSQICPAHFILPRALKESTSLTVFVDRAVRRVANPTRAFSGPHATEKRTLCPTSTCLFVKECALFARPQTEVHCTATASVRRCVHSNPAGGDIDGSSSAARSAQLRHSSNARKVLPLTPKCIIARMQ